MPAKSTKQCTDSDGSTQKTRAKSVKKPNVNAVRKHIRELATEHGFSEQVLMEFAEFINGGTFKAVELSMQEMKDAVCLAFNCKTYQDLKKNSNFQLYISDMNLKLNLKTTWQQLYREWVALPESERDAIGDGCINGIDIFRNFRPWEVFQLNPEKATAEDIKSAFRKLAMKYHPDHGGDRRIHERLRHMRDSLLAAY